VEKGRYPKMPELMAGIAMEFHLFFSAMMRLLFTADTSSSGSPDQSSATGGVKKTRVNEDETRQRFVPFLPPAQVGPTV
jgi:hypothetical protein